MKANHNNVDSVTLLSRLFIKSKIQFFESKSQHVVACTGALCVVYQVKDTIFWKQITTNMVCISSVILLFIKSKIQFSESKSQPTSYICAVLKVVYQVKDTIFWKQITTPWAKQNFSPTLFIKSKIQFFESKSQQSVEIDSILLSCLSSQRYNFLKANHNEGLKLSFSNRVVYQVKDTIFWKQITTSS